MQRMSEQSRMALALQTVQRGEMSSPAAALHFGVRLATLDDILAQLRAPTPLRQPRTDDEVAAVAYYLTSLIACRVPMPQTLLVEETSPSMSDVDMDWARRFAAHMLAEELRRPAGANVLAWRQVFDAELSGFESDLKENARLRLQITQYERQIRERRASRAKQARRLRAERRRPPRGHGGAAPSAAR